MPLNTQTQSSNSVVIKSVDRPAIEAAVETYVDRLLDENPEIIGVIWFGSWITGLPSPGSDVDLCLVLSTANKPRRDRVSEYLPVGFPVGLDLFPYTMSELEQLRQESPEWYREIMSGRKVRWL